MSPSSACEKPLSAARRKASHRLVRNAARDELRARHHSRRHQGSRNVAATLSINKIKRRRPRCYSRSCMGAERSVLIRHGRLRAILTAIPTRQNNAHLRVAESQVSARP